MNYSNTSGRGHGPLWHAAPLAPRTGDGSATIEISHCVTSDSPDSQPWPPSDINAALWAIVRRADGYTFWRAIQLAQVRSAAPDFCDFPEAATAVDLKGKAHIVTIESAPYETLKSLDGKEAQKVVLHFKNAEKTLPLNLTNFDAVCDATGFSDTEDWPGQRIELYPTRTSMGGKAVDCIRIRPPSASRPTAVAVSVPPPPAGEGSDEIPF
jgi:hypothetical protein